MNVEENDINKKILIKLVEKLLDDKKFLRHKDAKEYTGYIANIIKSNCK